MFDYSGLEKISIPLHKAKKKRNPVLLADGPSK